MEIYVGNNKQDTSNKAAEKAGKILNKAIERQGKATFVMATGNSQLDFISNLVQNNSVDWSKTEMFHLDEYIGISASHPASFRRYLKEKFINKINSGTVHLIKGDDEDIESECRRLNNIIADKKIDVAFVGIGENGHLAFNDPPADFDTETPYIIVELDEKCRQQQVGEGWFESIDQVPTEAISMSVQQILNSEKIICTVPGKRKSRAVRDCFGDWRVSPHHPASILKVHDHVFTYLDRDSASLLE